MACTAGLHAETALVSLSESATAGPKIDSGDTAWVLISAALVMLMLPGLAFFYGGLVRKKNVLSILMQCMMILCLVTIVWVLVGYSLAFGPDVRGVIGDGSWLALAGVGAAPSPTYATTIPQYVFVMFQAMFAVITPALIIGAFAERIRFGPFCIFMVLWSVLVYCPVAHWLWGKGGMLGTMGGAGALDFAGGTVVHVNAGMASLAAAIFLGKRKCFPDTLSPPHNLPFAALGAGLLWFGWFGFNAGSALQANGLAGSAFLATHVAAATAGLAWSILDWLKFGKPTLLGMITGAVAGLASVTQGAGYVTPGGAMVIGLLGGVVCWYAVNVLKARAGYDDSLDAFGVHGVGGIWGCLATGIWATTAVNSQGANGLAYGNPLQLWIQAKAALITMAYSFFVTLALFFFVNAILRLRVSDHDERVGLDLTQHREAGYTVID